jgi:hypothetical protein
MNEDLIARRAAERKEFEEKVLRPSLHLSSKQGEWTEADHELFRSIGEAVRTHKKYVLTEDEWLACNDSSELAWFEHPNLIPKRFEPLALKWCEQVRHLVWGPNNWTNRIAWLDAYLAYVEGRGPHHRDVCQRETVKPLAQWPPDVEWANAAIEAIVWEDDPHKAAVYAGRAASCHRDVQTGVEHRELDFEKREAASAAVWSEFLSEYRDVAGNPFRPRIIEPDWRTEIVISLARTMFEANTFDRMPILADALEEAGCDVEPVLSHCRDSKQVHVRGCWVVDLVLNRT